MKTSLFFLVSKFLLANSYNFLELFLTPATKYILLCSEDFQDMYFDYLNLNVHQGIQLNYWNCDTLPKVDDAILILGGHS